MKVSVIMANYRGARHLRAALTSVLGQSHADLEVIVADDASPDDSVAIAREVAATDARVQVLAAKVNAGPAAARNRAIEAATGEWVAIIDSDDLVHHDRIARLLAAATHLQADIIADDLVFFGDTPAAGGRTLLQCLSLRSPLKVTPDLWLRASGEDRSLPPLGYLKPMIRRSTIGALRYDEGLRIGEDYDFVLRLLLQGAAFDVLPDPMYLYRRHDASISHRLCVATTAAMLAAHDRVTALAGPALQGLLAARRKRLVAAWRYEGLVAAVKARRPGQALAALAQSPGLALNLARSLRERLSHREAPALADRPRATLHLGREVLAAPLALTWPAIPAPGAPWPDPPAGPAAALSALHGRYRLSGIAADDAGAWALGLVPPG